MKSISSVRGKACQNSIQFLILQARKIAGIFRHGVAWSNKPRIRLGEYDDDFVYSKYTGLLAIISDNVAVDIIGDTIGCISDEELYISNTKVASFIEPK